MSRRDHPKIRCVAFDFDGTLVRSNEIKRELFFETFARWPGSAPLVAEVLDWDPGADRSVTIPRICARLSDRDAPPEPGERLAHYTAQCEEAVVACEPLPGVPALLAALAARQPLYLNSATPQEALRRIVERRGWSRWFRAILGRPASKVDNLREIARREDLAMDELLLVGDGRGDLEAAEAVGCRFAGYRAPFDDPSLPELGALVAEIGGDLS